MHWVSLGRALFSIEVKIVVVVGAAFLVEHGQQEAWATRLVLCLLSYSTASEVVTPAKHDVVVSN